MATTEQEVVGTIGIDVEANIGKYERESGAALKQSSERIGREAGRALSEGIDRGAEERRSAFVERQMEMFRKQTDEARKAAEQAEKAIEPLGDTVEDTGKKSETASRGFNQMGTQITRVGTQVGRVNPTLGAMIRNLGSFAVSGFIMGAAFAGFSLLVAWLQKIRDSAKEAKEELEDNLETLKRMRLIRETEGDISLIQAADPARARRDDVYREIGSLEPREKISSTARNRLAELRAELVVLNREIEANDTALEERRRERREREAKEEEQARRERLRADKEMYGEARKLLEEWRRDQLLDLERQIEDMQKVRAAALKLGKTDEVSEIDRQIAVLQRQLDVYRQMERTLERLKDLRPTGPVAPGGISTAPVLPGVASETARIQAAMQRQIDLLQIARSRGNITEREMRDGMTQAADEAAQKLLTLLDLFEKLGIDAPDVVQAIAAALRALKGVTEENTATLSEYVQMFEAMGRGIMGALDAVGQLDDGTRQLLTGLLDVAAALDQLDRASRLDGFAKTLGMISGVGALVGGVLQVGSALFGESQAEREAREIMKRNTQALEDLALELSGFKVTTDVLQRFASAEVSNFDLSRPGIWAATSGSVPGFSNAELRALERELGITLFDSNGRLIPGAVRQAQESIRLRQQQGGGLFGGPGTVPPQERLSVSMTVVQGNRMIDILASSNDHLRALRDGLLSGARANIPVPATAAAAGGLSVHVEGPLVSLQLTGTGPGAIEEARMAGRAAGDGLMDRVAARYASAGISGPLVVRMDSPS